MRPYLLFLILLSTFIGNSQIVKQQIGYSTWIHQNQIVADSILTYVMTFDDKGQMRMEHRFLIDSNGNKADSIYSKIDTLGRYFFYKDNYSIQYTEFDSLGGVLFETIKYGNNTNLFPEEYTELIRAYKNTYNKRGRIIKAELLPTDETETKQTILYKNIGRWQIKKEEFITVCTRTNNAGKITHRYCTINIPGQEKPKSWSYRRRYSLAGNLKCYREKENGKATKITKHYYNKGVELKRKEYFIKKNFYVVTHFETSYY